MFINPSMKDIKIAKELNTDCIEIHTGNFANLVKSKKIITKNFPKLRIVQF